MKFNSLAKEIWQWAEQRNIFLFASYIPSSENVEADLLSRLSNDDTEWELAPYAFQQIKDRYATINIDLFATRKNSKCINFCSRFPDSEAMGIDAFTINWSSFKFYAFPPFALILKVLVKIKQEEAEGLVVVPNWPNQPWYPLFFELLRGDPIIFQPNTKLLLSPCRRRSHPRAEHLELMVGKLSARPLDRGAHLRRR